MLAARTVTTTGSGSVAVAREAAVLGVAAVHRAPWLAEALSGAESARAVVVGLAHGHVEPGAVTTQGLSTWPHHDEQGRAAGYEARHTLSIRCPGLEVASALLQALVDEAGDRLSVEGVSLVATPGAEDLAAAREAAYDDARTRATHLARLAGSELGAVVSLTEGPVPAPGPGVPGAATFLAKTAVGLEGGTEQVTTSVSVTWELG